MKMEAALVGALLNTIVPTIIKMLDERSKQYGKIKLDLEFIQRELPTICSTIEKDCQSARIDKLRQLAHAIEVCTSLFAYEQARKLQLRRRWPLQLRFPRRRNRNPLGSRSVFAQRLEELRNRCNEECTEENGGTPLPTPASEPKEPEWRKLVDTVGLDAPLGHLRGLLQPSGDTRAEEDKHKVISIVGPGGAGKTLLAARAYISMIGVGDEFCPQAWVCAADRNDEDILRDILANIDFEGDMKTLDKEGLIQSLKLMIRGKRYFIVIDDLRKVEQWTGIQSAFKCPEDKDATPGRVHMISRVIVTTTIQKIADACSSPNGCVYKMETLEKAGSTSLFIREAKLPQHRDAVEQYSAGLVSQCDGLPLALVSAAQFVQQNKRQGLDFCEQARSQLGSFLGKEKSLERMQWVLASSYNSLENSALKAQLLYFCTFNRSRPIRRNSLIRRWLAEGLINPIPQLNCSLLRQEYRSLCTLVDQNIIRPIEMSNNGKVKKCNPFGMVLEYISHKSMNDKLILLSSDQTPMPEFVRWVSLHQDTGDFSTMRPRTLVISGPAGTEVLKFTNCEAMRVLDLEDCTNLKNRHLQKICGLFLLRYLSLGGEGITKLPRKISRLEWLETLDLRKTAIEIVPLEVILLPHLRYLLGNKFQLNYSMPKADYERDRTAPELNSGESEKADRTAPELNSGESEKAAGHPDQKDKKEDKLKQFLQQKSKLETLAGFVAGRRGFPQLMPLMGRLRKVKIWCDLNADLTDLGDLSNAIVKFIKQGTGMPVPDRSLSIDLANCSPTFLDSLGGARGSLSSLKLCGNLTAVPEFVTRLRGIAELCLFFDTLKWNHIQDSMSNLNVLQHLKLVARINIEGDIVIIPGKFNALKRMCLQTNQSEFSITIQDKALKLLESLHLLCLGLDGSSAIQIEPLKNLEELGLYSGVDQKAWKKAVQSHPKRPNIVVIDP